MLTVLRPITPAARSLRRMLATKPQWRGKNPVTSLDWIAGMMSALAIAAVLWAAVAFA